MKRRYLDVWHILQRKVRKEMRFSLPGRRHCREELRVLITSLVHHLHVRQLRITINVIFSFQRIVVLWTSYRVQHNEGCEGNQQ